MQFIQPTLKELFLNNVSNRICHLCKDVRVWPSEERAGESRGTRQHGSDIPAGASSGGRHVSNPPISSQ